MCSAATGARDSPAAAASGANHGWATVLQPQVSWPQRKPPYGVTHMQQINALFTSLLNVGVGVGVTVAAFFLMWGAFMYMSASGSPRQMETGKAAMINALAGLAIVLSARVIAGMIQSALGGGG